MPSDSHFTLSVLDAVSLDPLREYKGPGGAAWVKGEHGEEFFVEVRCEMTKTVVCYVTVDGKDIGYTWITHRPNVSEPLGPLRESMPTVDAISTSVPTTAFQFVELEANQDDTAPPPSAEGGAADERVPIPANGTIVATWYTTEDTPVKVTSSHRLGDWESNAGTTDVGATDNKKDCSVLRSTKGSMPGSVPSVSDVYYGKKELLGRLEIKYSTDFGLAVRGLYPKQEVQYARPKKRKERGAVDMGNVDDDNDTSPSVDRKVKAEECTDLVVPKPEYTVVRTGGIDVIEIAD